MTTVSEVPLTDVERVALGVCASLYGTSTESTPRLRASFAAGRYVEMVGATAAIDREAARPIPKSRADRSHLIAGWGKPARERERREAQVAFSETELALAFDAFALRSPLGSASVRVHEINRLVSSKGVLPPDAEEIKEGFAWSLFVISSALAREDTTRLRGAESLSLRDRLGPIDFDYAKHREASWKLMTPDLTLPSYSVPDLKHQRTLVDLMRAVAEDQALLLADERASSEHRAGSTEDLPEQWNRKTLLSWRDLALLMARDLTPRIEVPRDSTDIKAGKLAREVAYYSYRVSRPSLANVRLALYGTTLRGASVDAKKK